ncbi:MAG: helix-turn-helix transcriptional regulator [Acidobacteriota bacterium]
MQHDDGGQELPPAGEEQLTKIGTRLRELRKNQRLSQREVADAIGLPQSNLSRIETGKQRLNLPVLMRMLGIYDVTLQDFFSQEPAPPALELAPQEKQLIESYRRLTAEERQDVESYVDFKLFRSGTRPRGD